MVGGCITDNRISNIKFLRRVIGRNPDCFEYILAANDGVGPLW